MQRRNSNKILRKSRINQEFNLPNSKINRNGSSHRYNQNSLNGKNKKSRFMLLENLLSETTKTHKQRNKTMKMFLKRL